MPKGSGQHPRTLGWTPGPEDPRDYQLEAYATGPLALKGEKGWGWRGMPDLDQEREGACTSFSIGNALNCEPGKRTYDSPYCFDAYHATTEHDSFPGDWRTGQEGTSVRAAMQEWLRRGAISAYAFTYTVEQIVSHVLSKGPLCIGIDWREGYDDPTEEDGWRVRPEGEVRGGHAIAIIKARWGLDDDNHVLWLNSWGRDNYGLNGRAKVPEVLLREIFEDPTSTAIAPLDIEGAA